MSQNSSKANNNLINALLYIVVGVLLCVFRTQFLNWAMTAIGVVIIVVGVLDIIKNRLVEGIIMAAVGLLVILGGWLVLDIMLLMLGVVFIAKGIIGLIRRADHGVAATVSSVITILVGVLLVVSKWAFLDWMLIILGVILIVDGALLAIGKR